MVPQDLGPMPEITTQEKLYSKPSQGPHPHSGMPFRPSLLSLPHFSPKQVRPLFHILHPTPISGTKGFQTEFWAWQAGFTKACFGQSLLLFIYYLLV
jgi:hypothetical protein